MRDLSRRDVLTYRMWVNHLSGPALGRGDLVTAAAPGLQDSAPRSALLSLAARVEGVRPDDWRAPGLAQVFGPRGAIYVVPAPDVPVFTRGLLPRDPMRLQQLREAARHAGEVLAGKPMRQRDLDAALSEVDTNRELRWAACLGTLRPVWDTADTFIHPAAEPAMDVETARLELARRFFQYLGPATPEDFRWWIAGERSDAALTIGALDDELTLVTVDGQNRLALTSLLPRLVQGPHKIDPGVVHLLPPDDPYINRRSRETLLPDPGRRRLLWPQAPPPGALVIGGEVAGTWRRRGGSVRIETWQPIAPSYIERAEQIASRWPLGDEQVRVTWKKHD